MENPTTAADGTHVHIPIGEGVAEVRRKDGQLIVVVVVVDDDDADISALSRWKLLRRCQTAAVAAKNSSFRFLAAAVHCCYLLTYWYREFMCQYHTTFGILILSISPFKSDSFILFNENAKHVASMQNFKTPTMRSRGVLASR